MAAVWGARVDTPYVTALATADNLWGNTGQIEVELKRAVHAAAVGQIARLKARAKDAARLSYK